MAHLSLTIGQMTVGIIHVAIPVRKVWEFNCPQV